MGQEVTGQAELPISFTQVAPPGPYARFATMGHSSTMSADRGEVCNDWLCRPALHPRKGPAVEYYPPSFNGMTGNGGFEVWVPIEG